MKKYYFLLLCIILLSCRKQDTHLVKQVIDNFEDTISVKGYKTGISDIEIINSIYVFDTLIVCKLFPYLQYSYRAYSLNTAKKTGDFLAQGRGANEFLNPQIISNVSVIKNGDINIWVQDFPSKIALLNLSKTLSTGNAVIDKEYNFIHKGKRNILFESNDTHVLEDGVFLMNKDIERSINSDNNNPEQMYVIFDCHKNQTLDTLKYRYALESWSCIDHKKTKIVSTYYCEDLISIYDISNKQEKVLFHTLKDPEKLAGLKHPDIKKPDFTYYKCDIKRDLIFALYNKNKIDPDQQEKVNSYIHIFDLNGKPLYNLILSEQIGAFCFDERSSILYGIDSEGQIYAYNLKNILQKK